MSVGIVVREGRNAIHPASILIFTEGGVEDGGAEGFLLQSKGAGNEINGLRGSAGNEYAIGRNTFFTGNNSFERKRFRFRVVANQVDYLTQMILQF